MSTNNGITPKTVANMQTHYANLLKAGAENLGADAMSKSIFAQIDSDRNGTISQNEIDAAMPSLSEILTNAAQKAQKFAKAMFGPSPQQEKMSDEISNAYNQIIQYAEAHPEDSRIQEYAARAKEMMQNGNINAGTLGENVEGQYFVNSDSITLDHDKYSGSDNVLKVLLHELGHAQDNDGLDSLAEEKDVEIYARKIAADITKKPIEDIADNTIDEFLEHYENNNYPKNSPGHNGIPKNAGVTIDYNIESVKRDGNNFIIKSEPNSNGRYIETIIIMGKNTDSEGNLLPVSAQQILHNSDGSTLETNDMGEYNLKERRFIQPVSEMKVDDKMQPIDNNIPEKMEEIKLDKPEV